jgi:hypothetical protein
LPRLLPGMMHRLELKLFTHDPYIYLTCLTGQLGQTDSLSTEKYYRSTLKLSGRLKRSAFSISLGPQNSEQYHPSASASCLHVPWQALASHISRALPCMHPVASRQLHFRGEPHFLAHLARHALIHSRASSTFSGSPPPVAAAPAGTSFCSPLCHAQNMG